MGVVRQEARPAPLARLALSDLVIYLILLALLGFFSFAAGPSFLGMFNVMNILRQTAMISIMAVGMTFALAAGEIDLSVGATIGLTALVAALALLKFGTVAGVVAGLGVGLGIGLVNGALVATVRMPSFLVTLGTMGIVGGLSRWVTNLKSVEIVDDTFNFLFGAGDVGPVPILFFWTLGVAAAGWVLLNRTPFGKAAVATGGNERAAYYSGINTRWVKVLTLLVSSLSASLAGLLYAGRLHGARYTMGEGFELSVIAATVLGGTSLFGGRATVIGSVVGSIVIGVINNGLVLLGLSVAQQMFFRGVILLVAVALNVVLRKD